jgi:2,5-diketo-D-gluconate reductase A
MTAPLVTLNDGNSIPAVGLGFFQVPAGGHRAIAESDVPRDQLYVVTKLWNADQRADTRPGVDSVTHPTR